MATRTNRGLPTPQISFAEMVKVSYDAAWQAGLEEVDETMQEHHARWTATFGNNEMVGDKFGNRGAAPGLADATIAAKMEKGHSEESAEAMLSDRGGLGRPGALVDSTMVDGPHIQADEARLRAVITGSSLIDNPVFPLNEFGYGISGNGKPVPIRTSLLPTDEEVSRGFEARAMQRIGRAMNAALLAAVGSKK